MQYLDDTSGTACAVPLSREPGMASNIFDQEFTYTGVHQDIHVCLKRVSNSAREDVLVTKPRLLIESVEGVGSMPLQNRPSEKLLAFH